MLALFGGLGAGDSYAALDSPRRVSPALMKICPTCQRNYPDDFSVCPRDATPLTAQATEADAQLAAGLSSRFRIIRQLGQGGMGTVFLAEQIGVGNRLVALKVLNRKLLDDPDFLLRFRDEAGSTGRIHHPNVVTIYESAQGDDGTPYISMEFLEGESLREVLKRRGALPLKEVAVILQQTARGLNAAHKLGIIHRDLKPDNVFLTQGDENETVVKVLDFGIAKLLESSMHTQTGMVLGTPAYMSYEQASGMRSDELDARSDIYSLGVVVYEMLSGRVPFHSDTPLGYLRKHMLEEPPPLTVVAQDLQVPPQVEAVVLRALKKERRERYQSAIEFAHAFMEATAPARAPEVSEPLPSTKVVVLPAGRQFETPMPVPVISQAKVDSGHENPSIASPARNAGTPIVPPPRVEPVGGGMFSAAAASHSFAAPTPTQSRLISEPPKKMKFVVITAVAMILIGAGVWHFLPFGTPQTGVGRKASVVDTSAPTAPSSNQASPQAPRVQSEQRTVKPSKVITIPKLPPVTSSPLGDPPQLRMPTLPTNPGRDADQSISPRPRDEPSVGTTTPESPAPQPVIVKVLSGPFIVPALGYSSVNFQVDSERMQQARLFGNFTLVANKAGKKLDIEMCLLNGDQFRMLTRGQSTTTLYNTGRVTDSRINLSIPQSGTYYLVFNNKFSVLTPKTVSGVILLQYLPAQ